MSRSVSVTASGGLPAASDVGVAELAVSAPRVRLASIDQLRGLVIALMALDHVRDYFTSPALSPTDLSKTSSALFFTRWITHFCAPTFVFLAGASAYLSSRQLSRSGLSRFLWTRGLWLVALEFSVVSFAWNFNFAYPMGLVMQVIWTIGVSMCALAALVWLPVWAVGAFGVLMIAGHNLLDGIAPTSLGAWAPLWNVLHVGGRVPLGYVVYPLIPWVGVMATGYAFGQVYRWPALRRQRFTLGLGLALSAAFVLLRLANGYGDPSPWSPQPRPGFTALSFLNVSKYPPSLLYLLMTLGPALLCLRWLESARGTAASVLATFGRVPLFAYVVHIALAHLLAGLTGLALGYGPGLLTNFFLFYPASWGFGLGVVYCVWLAVLLLLYPACRWFGEVKRTRREWWLKYL